jgi:allophanate hydrolase subunit 2
MGEKLSKGRRLLAQERVPTVSTERVALRRPSEPPQPLPQTNAHFEILRGPQHDAFSEKARQALVDTEWTLSLRSDRTGYRLDGASLLVPDSIPSEPVLPGSFQVPAGGSPIVTMPDGPTVGGYAKIAVLRESDLSAFAQCPPQTKLRFSWID